MKAKNLIVLWITAMVAAESAIAAPPQAEIQSYPTAGVAFAAPKDWKEFPRTKPKTIAAWVSPDSTLERPRAMIIVEIGLPSKGTLEVMAQGLAKGFGGSVDDRTTTLDGSRTLRVVAKHSERELKQIMGLVTFHDRLMYTVIAASLPGRSLADEIEAIRASWKWIPIDSPHKHLEFRDANVPIFGGLATLNMPERMFSAPSEHPDRILDLQLDNVLRYQADFYAYVQLLTIPAGSSFEAVTSRIDKNWAPGSVWMRLFRGKFEARILVAWRPSSSFPKGLAISPRMWANLQPSSHSSKSVINKRS